ncbi:MAG: 4-deoxy-4-formamido-L-arabinose-phosphoundecaprenol deformylase [Syntrophaceae bacterium]|nr:4-deoxy-4-formamido-L-arabinose-phosphoundecaprenol deformylase [Syntrophaceae bacterium]
MAEELFRVGLRIDVDTFRGTGVGVPNLLRVLAEHRVQGTFFFSVGPDNMGRHIWRLFRPEFLRKMWRTKAPNLYGWNILLRGALWPGPLIGKELSHVIKATACEGHEIGLHAWDHYRWQTHIESMTGELIHRQLVQGFEAIRECTGTSPICSAAPSWRITEQALLEKAKLPFRYNSDCRGRSVFYPVVKGIILPQPQIPSTLPTYDEVVGRDGVTQENYNRYLISLMRPDSLNVLTIHAEVEGISCLGLFRAFLQEFQIREGCLVPLGELLPPSDQIGRAVIGRQRVEGREGWVSVQQVNAEVRGTLETEGFKSVVEKSGGGRP